MKRKIALILTAVLLGLAVCLPAAAAGAGTADDPLVTLSYLNETFLAAVQKRWPAGTPASRPTSTGSWAAALRGPPAALPW